IGPPQGAVWLFGGLALVSRWLLSSQSRKRYAMHKVVGTILCGLVVTCAQAAWGQRQGEAAKPAIGGPLRDYVEKEDTSFGWKKRREGKIGSGQYVELTLTSQIWKNITWKHQLLIYKPAKVQL